MTRRQVRALIATVRAGYTQDELIPINHDSDVLRLCNEAEELTLALAAVEQAAEDVAQGVRAKCADASRHARDEPDEDDRQEALSKADFLGSELAGACAVLKAVRAAAHPRTRRPRR